MWREEGIEKGRMLGKKDLKLPQIDEAVLLCYF